ncbi:MAG: ABC transporter ATP-binding protein/permease [Defluviitaleaceae bacterium]|nr:ABC transporter ATP-binding protein/permease [Defluviitaleaceae bacterium]
MKPFRLCKVYLSSQKYSLLGYVAIVLASTIISILTPYIIGDFLDTLISGADMGVILRFGIIFGGLSLLKIIKGYITAIMNTKMQIKMSYNLNRDTIKHIQGLSLSYINQKDSAYLSQRVGDDANSLISFCISILRNIITNTIMVIVPFVILLTMNWLIAVLMLGFVAVYMALYFAFKKPLYTAGFAHREALAKFFSKILEQLRYAKLIKLNSIQDKMIKRADDSFAHQRDTALHNQKINYFYNSADGIISTIAQISLFVIGGLHVLAGNFTIGMFTIFTSYFNMMLGACRYFFSLGGAYQRTMVAHDRIREILDQKPESQGEKLITNIEKIELQNVNFSYNGNAKKQTVTGINALFNKGYIYVITGPNGAGKSTLINLLLGMYIDEYKGSITYNGIDIRNINMVAARRDQLGFAEQEPQLINDTIRYNLSFGKSLNEKLSNLIDILNMNDFIAEHSLDYVLNEKTTNTSGGEKQKIAILKVLSKDPDVMVFDEPSSALEKGTVEKFMEYLHQIKKDKIIIIITHDEIIKAQCDINLKIDSTKPTGYISYSERH